MRLLKAGILAAIGLSCFGVQAEMFWSLQMTNYPPFPANPFPDLPVYAVGGDNYLYDDSKVDYVQIQQEAELLKIAERVLGISAQSESSGGQYDLLSSSCGGYLLLPVYQVTNVIFTLTNTAANEVYDLFTVSNLNLTNWTWLMRGSNGQTEFVITNPPEFESYYVAGCTNDDADGEGLTDLYEQLVSQTDPYDPDTDYDGRSDYEEVYPETTDPLDAASFTPTRLGYFRFNAESLAGERGQLPLTTNNL